MERVLQSAEWVHYLHRDASLVGFPISLDPHLSGGLATLAEHGLGIEKKNVMGSKPDTFTELFLCRVFLDTGPKIEESPLSPLMEE